MAPVWLKQALDSQPDPESPPQPQERPEPQPAQQPAVVSAAAAELANLLMQAKKQGADLILVDTAGHADASSLHALHHADLGACRA